MKFNDEAALELANIIVPLYEARKPPFNIQSCETILPEGMKEKSKEHALYLFYAAIGNYHVDSDVFYGSTRRFYEKHPEYFEPETIIKEFSIEADDYSDIKRILDDKEITISPEFSSLVKENLGGRWWEIGKRWWNNSTELEKYDFDPRNIFEEGNTVDDVFKKLDGHKHRKTKIQYGFRGMKQKIGNMLINQYIEAGIFPRDISKNSKVPIDFHVVNLCVAQGILTDFENGVRDTKVSVFLDQELTRLCQEYDINGLNLDKALWRLGKYTCSYNNSNKTCPLKRCEKNISSEIYFDSGKIVVIDNPRGC